MNSKTFFLALISVLLIAIFIAILWRKTPEETKKVPTEITKPKKSNDFPESTFVRDSAKNMADVIIADLIKAENIFNKNLSALESSLKGDTSLKQRNQLIDLKFDINYSETEIRRLQEDKSLFHTLSDGKVKAILKEYAWKKDSLLQKTKGIII